MSDTPKTNEFLGLIAEAGPEHYGVLNVDDPWPDYRKLVDFARILERENAALREADTGDMVLVPREPKRGLLCGDVAISTDPRYAGWVFVRHVDGENWTTGAKLTPETWAMLAAAEEERSRG